MQSLTFITGNAGKAKYLSDYFHIPVTHLKLDLKEIQSLDLEEVVKDKARRAYEIVKSPVLVEDTSLIFTGLKTLPGPLIKWFFETLGNEGLCKLIDNFGTRDAFAEVKFGICDGKEAYIFTGSMQGGIASTPRGEAGFGWDSIFIPQGYEKTWAEMTGDDKHKTSMRKVAIEAMVKFLGK